MQTLVLGASLASLAAPQPPSASSGPITIGPPSAAAAAGASSRPRGALQQLQEQGTPEILVVMAAVRFLVVPVATLAVVGWTSRLGWLPLDGSCRLALLLLVHAHPCA